MIRYFFILFPGESFKPCLSDQITDPDASCTVKIIKFPPIQINFYEPSIGLTIRSFIMSELNMTIYPCHQYTGMFDISSEISYNRTWEIIALVTGVENDSLLEAPGSGVKHYPFP